MGVQSMARVEITGIDAAQLGLTLADGVRTGRLELQVYAGDAKQTVIGDVAETLELQASEETYAGWLAGGIRRVVRVPSFGVPRYIKVVVYD